MCPPPTAGTPGRVESAIQSVTAQSVFTTDSPQPSSPADGVTPRVSITDHSVQLTTNTGENTELEFKRTGQIDIEYERSSSFVGCCCFGAFWTAGITALFGQPRTALLWLLVGPLLLVSFTAVYEWLCDSQQTIRLVPTTAEPSIELLCGAAAIATIDRALTTAGVRR